MFLLHTFENDAFETSNIDTPLEGSKSGGRLVHRIQGADRESLVGTIKNARRLEGVVHRLGKTQCVSHGYEDEVYSPCHCAVRPCLYSVPAWERFPLHRRNTTLRVFLHVLYMSRQSVCNLNHKSLLKNGPKTSPKRGPMASSWL